LRQSGANGAKAACTGEILPIRRLLMRQFGFGRFEMPVVQIGRRLAEKLGRELLYSMKVRSLGAIEPVFVLLKIGSIEHELGWHFS
jgi:hypothetical protein